MTYSFNKRLKATFLGNIAVNNYKFRPVNRSTNFGTSTDAKQFTVYFDGQEKDRFETYFGALSINYKYSKSTDFSLLASGYLTNELVAYDISGEYWLDQAGTTGGSGDVVGGELGVGRYHEHARNRLKASVMTLTLKGNTGISGHNISYGLVYNHEKIHDRSREWELRDSAGYSLPSTGDAVHVIYNIDSKHDISSNRLSLYAQDTYRLNSNIGLFTLNGGVRVSYWDFNDELLVSPRVNASFIPEFNNSFAFRFATGLYYQSPFYKEYRMPTTDADGNTVIKLNSDIKSQRSFHLILGSEYTFRALDRPFKFSAEAYYKHLSNLIPYEVDNLKIVYSGNNQSKGYTTGLDLKLFGQFVPGTDSWISFSLMKTQRVSASTLANSQINFRDDSFMEYFQTRSPFGEPQEWLLDSLNTSGWITGGDVVVVGEYGEVIYNIQLKTTAQKSGKTFELSHKALLEFAKSLLELFKEENTPEKIQAIGDAMYEKLKTKSANEFTTADNLIREKTLEMVYQHLNLS